MPELPEVEIYTRYFAEHALRQEISRVEVRDERVLGEIRKEPFVKALKGRRFKSTRRHGKHLFADAGTGWLHLHFGMTGDLAYYDDAAKEPRFARVVFGFRNGSSLAFEDMRLFGVVDMTPEPDQFITEHRLGPDPLDPRFTLPLFRKLIANRRGAMKSLLMSQDVIAGLGNLYVDETLFLTGIHPRRPVDALQPDEVKAVHAAIRKILRDVIARKARGAGYPPRYLVNHREVDARCPRCGGTIKRSVVFGRTTYFCAKHQK